MRETPSIPAKGEFANRPTESPAWEWLRRWRTGQPGDVRKFLAERTLTAVETVAVLLVEQRERRELGEHLRAESFFSWYPELRSHAEAAVELIYGEFLLRKQFGDAPSTAEYQQRFPDYVDWLSRQFALHSALQDSSSPSVQTVDYVSDSVTTDHFPARESPEELSTITEGSVHRIGRYELQSVLGKGGMGIAYQAWDPLLKRVVVVKTLRTAGQSHEGERARFRAEAEAIAQIRHAHIVQVFDVGEHGGEPYFAMEFCEGGSLVGKLRDPLPPHEAAQLVEQITRGVAAAHDRNIIHRDLKPGNILLTSDPTIPTSDHPAPTVAKVTDFGLAKMLDGQDDQTRTGAVMGTPAYMAPEQAFGASKDVGPTADVYALGVILYECLTGRPPFKGATTAETLDQVRHREPLPVRQLQPKTPVDLETIALKCLQKEPSRRYLTATALAEDLNRFLEGRPILARPIGTLERAWRWCRRNRLVASLTVMVLMVLLAGLGTTTVMWLRAKSNHERAEKNFQLSEMNFEKTVTAVNTYFRTVSENRLLFLPEMQPIRKELMVAARPFFETFAQDRKDDPRFRQQLAIVHLSLAKIEKESGTSAELLSHLQTAHTLLLALRKEDPENSYLRTHLASCLQELSYFARGRGNFRDSLQHLQEASEHFAFLAAETPQEVYFIQAEVDCCIELAELNLELGQRDEAKSRTAQSLRRAKEHAKQVPGDPAVQLHLAHTHAYAGQLLVNLNNPNDAIPELERAREILTPLVNQAFYRQAQARYELARTQGILGPAYLQCMRPQDAEKAMLVAESLFEQLTVTAPTVRQYRFNRAINQRTLATLYTNQSKLTEAERWCMSAITALEQLHGEAPDKLPYVQELALNYRGMIRIARSSKQPEKQSQWSEKAIQFLKVQVKAHPSTLELKEMLAKSAGSRGRLLLEQAKYQQALLDLDVAIDHCSGELQEGLRSSRAVCRAKFGDWTGAEADCAAVPTTKESIESEHDLLRVNAWCFNRIMKDSTLSDAARKAKGDRLAQEAMGRMQHLKPVLQADPQFRQKILTDPDLQALFKRSEYQKFLQSLPR